MSYNQKILFAKGKNEVFLLPKTANLHGLISGATGTGKTVSLQVLAESFSEIGVPVFLADIKGDLAGLSVKGESKSKAYPVVFWDVFGQQGHPLRATFSDVGPLLLSRLLNLNNTQSGILNVVFKIADDMGMLLIDLKDLREMLRYVGDNAKNYTTQYGNINKQSIGAIQRALLVLEEQGAEHFFAEPAVNIIDFIRTDASGRGNINILASDQLYHFPALYTTFLLWLLSELFEKLPEIGDLGKPRLVFFFDEAHTLFKGTPKVLIQKIEQVIRLIRSKGVGVYFITQSPKDIPETILGQLGNKVLHALRVSTPRDQAVVKAIADTFRPNPSLNIEQAITQLSVGEALISFLDEEGRPNMVERACVIPPRSHIGPISLKKRGEIIDSSPLAGRYEDMFDRESAYEKLQSSSKQYYDHGTPGKGTTSSKPSSKKRTTDTPMDRMTKSAMSSIGREIGRELARGFLGTLFKK